MTENPQNYAESPHDTDVLSELLRAIRLHGDAVARHRPASGGHGLRYSAGSRALHIGERGRLRLQLSPPHEAIPLGPGDLALLANGAAHTVLTEDGAWITGTFTVDAGVADPVLAVLPPAIVIRADGATDHWLPLGLELLLAETVRPPRPGSRVMVSRILDLLFIHALRTWAASGHTEPGWLTAAMDVELAPVLSAVHQDPGADWSIDELARLASMSRSAFADRFVRLLGHPPATYVRGRRMHRAAHLLTETDLPIRRIANQVGYRSEAAFSRAFRRQHGVAPRGWRRRPDRAADLAGPS